MIFTENIYVYADVPADLTEIGEMLIEWDSLPEISRVMNTSFYFYGTYRRDGQNAEMLQKGAVLRAYCEDDTWQYFRISKVNPTLENLSVTARPIAFDANNNFVENVFVDSGNGQTIMSRIQNNLTFPQSFRYTSNVSSFHQFTIKEAKPLEAIWGSNNGQQNLIGVTGGELDFDNYDIKLVERIGKDSGFTVDFGVNLESIESEMDDESVVNSLYLVGGTADNDYDEEKEPIRYKYLTQAGVTDKNRRIAKRENSECKTIDDLKKWGQSLFDKDRIHEPNATHKISMTMLECTEEYFELYQNLHKLHFGDTAHVYNDKYEEYFEERMFEYVWYPTLKKFKSIVLGSAGKRYTAAVQTETQILQQKLENKTEMLVEAVRNASSWITGSKGGYVRFRPEKSPREILIMDNPVASEAKKVWRWNMGGLGYSSTGVDGSYGLAMTQDGAIVADFITAGILSGILVQGVALKTLDSRDFQVVMEGGKLSFEKQVTSTGLNNVHGEGLGRIVATYGATGINGFAIVQEPGYIFSINTGGNDGRSVSVFQLPRESTPDNRLYNLLGKGTFSGGTVTFKDDVVFEKNVEIKGKLTINGQQVYPGGSGGGGIGPSGAIYQPINIGSNITGNANIVAWLEKYTALYGISDYIGLAYALIMVENGSTDGTDDIMQSSESAGYPGPGYLTGEASIDQGCKHLAAQIQNGITRNVDIWGVMQGYNFGSAYIPWLSGRGGVNTTDLAETYSRTVVAPSLGNTAGATYSYVNAVSQADGRTYLYRNGGNFHYAAMIRQYVQIKEQLGYAAPIGRPITITSEFGNRTHPVTGAVESFHTGLDIVNGNATAPIFASQAGEVVFAGDGGGYGNYITLLHADGLYTGYGHLSAISVSVSQQVAQGQRIGTMGSTGTSTGPHLHFEFKNAIWPSQSGFMNPHNYVDI